LIYRQDRPLSAAAQGLLDILKTKASRAQRQRKK
jgi:hypothetical protein